MVEVKVSGVPARVTVEYKCLLCGAVAALGPIELFDGQRWMFGVTPKGWRQLGAYSVCCPEHPGVELGLVKDGAEHKPDMVHSWLGDHQ